MVTIPAQYMAYRLLFDGSDGDEAMESVEVPDVTDPNVNGIKRKLVEDEDYD